MDENSILEEVWRIKDELAREAGYDIHQLCENTRRWAAAQPQTGPLIHNAEELRKWMEQKQAERARSLALKEEPPKPTGS